MAEVTKVGTEFLVNTQPLGEQKAPKSTPLAGGGFVVTWTDESGSLGDSSFTSVKAQIYASDGTRIGSEFLVNTQTAGYQGKSSIAGLTGGGFVVTWEDSSRTLGDTSAVSVKAQLYNASGTKVGEEFLVNTSVFGDQIDTVVTGLTSGGFVVGWVDYNGTLNAELGDFNGTSDRSSVKLQIYNSAGAKVGPELLVEQNVAYAQLKPQITSLVDGGFIVSWRDSSTSINGQLFDSTGVKIGSEISLNTTATAEITAYNSQAVPVIASLASGGFVAAWANWADGSDRGVVAQIFGPTGQKVGTEFIVNSNITGAQDTPSIASLPGGGFIISWQDSGGTLGDSSDTSIKAQVFDSNGTKVAGEFLVNTQTAGHQWGSTVTSLGNGRFVVSWQDSGGTLGDSSGSSIRAQLFAINNAPSITSNGGGATASLSLFENIKAVTTVTATDVDANTTFSYSISGGVDAALFEINSATGALSFKTAPNFEAPADVGTNNVYDVVVQVSDGTLTDTQAIAVTVTNVNEAPTFPADLRVNNYTDGRQWYASVAALADGGWIVAWVSVEGPLSTQSIYAQRFSSNGVEVGAEFLVNTLDSVNKVSQRGDFVNIVGRPDGGWVVMWDGLDESGTGIFYKIYDSSGNNIGDSKLVSSVFNDNQYTQFYSILSGDSNNIFVKDDGSFAVTFISRNEGNYEYDVYFREFDKFGVPRTENILVNAFRAGNQTAPSISALVDGGWIVAWQSQGQDSPETDRFGSSSGIFAQRFDKTGKKMSEEFQVNSFTRGGQQTPVVAALSDGGWVITWDSRDQFDNSDLFSQRFDKFGNPVGQEFRVNSYTGSDQHTHTMVPFSDGGWLTAWSSAHQDGSDFGVFYKIFDAAGVDITGDVQVNRYTDNVQLGPSVRILKDGGWIIAFQSNVGGLPEDIYIQRFDSSGNNIDVVSTNSAPNFAAASQTVSTNEDTAKAITLAATDADNDSLTYTAAAAANGTVAVSGAVVTYTPRLNYNGTDSFVVTASDGKGGTATQTVNVTVAAVNDAPVITSNGGGATAAVSIAENATSVTSVTASDVDVNSTLTYSIVGGADASLFQINASTGALSFMSAPNFEAPADSGGNNIYDVTVQASDGSLTDTQAVAVTVTNVNEAPTFSAASQSVSATAGIAKTITLAATDVDGDTLSYTVATPGKGTATISGSTLTYTPTSSASDSDSFVVTASDGKGGTATQTINATISGSNTGPSIVSNVNKVGTEFLVNGSTSSDQSYPVIAKLAGGGFVIGWIDQSGTLGDGSGKSVKAQIYNSSGTKIGSEFLVNSQTSGDQILNGVTALSNGRFVFTWFDYSGTLGDSSSPSIKAQIFDPTGSKVGSEFLVNTQVSSEQKFPALGALTGGGFVVTWEDYSGTLGDASGHSIKAQIFDQNGSRIGSEFLVNSQTLNFQWAPAVAGLPNGGFVVAWQDGTAWQPGSGSLGDTSSGSIKAQVFNSAGQKIGSEFLVNSETSGEQALTGISSFANGNVIIVWEDASGTLGDDNGRSIKAQIFNSAGTKIGSEFLVNDQKAGDQLNPYVTELPGGAFMIAWEDASGATGDGSGYGIKAQIYSAAGIKVSNEFILNATTAGNQYAPSLIALNNGTIVSVWMDQSGSMGDTSGLSIKAQLLTLDTAGITIPENSAAITTVKASDADSNAILSYSIFGGADAALFQINGSTGVLSFKAAPNFEAPTDVGTNNVYDVVVQVSDGTLTDTQAIAVTVTNVNDAPTFSAASQAISANEDTAKAITLAATDADSDPLTYTAAPAANGTVAVSGAVVTYTPRLNYNGTDSFIVTASDGKGGSANQTVNVTVAAVNDAPIFSATSQSVSATAGTAKTITLAATDVDGDTLTYTVATPSKGTATISGSTLTYTPTVSSSGADSFSVTASDGKGGTAIQTLNATIAAAPTSSFRLTVTDGWKGSVGGNGLVFGTSGYQDITVLSGSVTFDASFNKGGDIIRFDNPASSYTVVRSGSSAQISAGSLLTATVPMGTIGIATSFADGIRKMVFSGGSFVVGSQAFSSPAASITAIPDGTPAPTGANSAAGARLSLSGGALAPSQTAHVTISGKATIFGTSSNDIVALDAGKSVNLTFDASFNQGGDIIILDKDAGSYSAVRSGSSIVLTATNETLSIPVGTAGLTLRFTDGDRTMLFAGGAFKIGDQTIGTAATALTPSVTFTSIDIGTASASETVSGAGAKVIFTDDATKNSFVKITNFGSDDLIRVTGATNYDFTTGDLDSDGAADDLSISLSNAETGIINEIFVLNSVSPEAFVFDRASAVSAVGFNFITFG